MCAIVQIQRLFFLKSSTHPYVANTATSGLSLILSELWTRR